MLLNIKYMLSNIFNTDSKPKLFCHFALIILALLSIFHLISYLLIKNNNFDFINIASGVFVEMHGLFFDVILFGIIMSIYEIYWNKREFNKQNEIFVQNRIQRYHEEIDDYRQWHSDEAKYRIFGLIKRLNKDGVSRINLSDCYLPDLRFSFINLNNADVLRATLNNCDFSTTQLENTNLSFSKMNNIYVGNGNAKEAIFKEAYIQKSNFSAAYLFMANFMYSHLEGSEFHFSRLEKANFAKSFLNDVSFEGAILINANFNEALMDNTDLCLANLTGVYLSDSQLNVIKTLRNATIDDNLKKRVIQLRPDLLN